MFILLLIATAAITVIILTYRKKNRESKSIKPPDEQLIPHQQQNQIVFPPPPPPAPIDAPPPPFFVHIKPVDIVHSPDNEMHQNFNFSPPPIEFFQNDETPPPPPPDFTPPMFLENSQQEITSQSLTKSSQSGTSKVEQLEAPKLEQSSASEEPNKRPDPISTKTPSEQKEEKEKSNDEADNTNKSNSPSQKPSSPTQKPLPSSSIALPVEPKDNNKNSITVKESETPPAAQENNELAKSPAKTVEIQPTKQLQFDQKSTVSLFVTAINKHRSEWNIVPENLDINKTDINQFYYNKLFNMDLMVANEVEMLKTLNKIDTRESTMKLWFLVILSTFEFLHMTEIIFRPILMDYLEQYFDNVQNQNKNMDIYLLYCYIQNKPIETDKIDLLIDDTKLGSKGFYNDGSLILEDGIVKLSYSLLCLEFTKLTAYVCNNLVLPAHLDETIRRYTTKDSGIYIFPYIGYGRFIAKSVSFDIKLQKNYLIGVYGSKTNSLQTYAMERNVNLVGMNPIRSNIILYNNIELFSTIDLKPANAASAIGIVESTMFWFNRYSFPSLMGSAVIIEFGAINRKGMSIYYKTQNVDSGNTLQLVMRHHKNHIIDNDQESIDLTNTEFVYKLSFESDLNTTPTITAGVSANNNKYTIQLGATKYKIDIQPPLTYVYKNENTLPMTATTENPKDVTLTFKNRTYLRQKNNMFGVKEK